MSYPSSSHVNHHNSKNQQNTPVLFVKQGQTQMDNIPQTKSMASKKKQYESSSSSEDYSYTSSSDEGINSSEASREDKRQMELAAMAKRRELAVIAQNKLLQERAEREALESREMEKQDMIRYNQEADIKWNTVKYEGQRSFKIRKFTAKNGALKNEGMAVFTLKHLKRVGGSNISDFKDLRKDQLGGKHDLIKRINLKLTSNYPETLVISFHTISAIGKEFFRDEANHVNYTIEAGTFALGEKRQYSQCILDRKVSNLIKEYVNDYRGYNPDNMDSDIYYLKDQMVLPIGHPALMVYNTEKAIKGQEIEKPNVPQLEANNEAMIPRQLGEECLKIAKESLSKSLPLGNITDKLKVVISTVMPYQRKKGHESGKDQFKGLGDAKHLLASTPFAGMTEHPTTKVPILDHIGETEIELRMWLEFEYARLDGKQI